MAVRPHPGDAGFRVSAAWWRRWLPDLLALGLLTLATAGFFWRILFAGAWMPAGGGDLAALLYPTYHFAAQSLKSGIFPLWNPYLWGGAPFAADIQSGLFYPVNLIYFRLAPEVLYRGLMGLAVFHFWLAGLGMFLYLRRFLAGSSILPPLGGALAFMFSDYFIVHFGNLNLVAQAAWLPLIFLFYHRSLAERRLGPAVWAGLCLAMAATAGHAQPLMLIGLGLGWDLLVELGLAFADVWATQDAHSGRKGLVVGQWLRAAWPPLSTLVVMLGIGLGVAAIALVPAYEMTRHTLRADYSYAQASAYSLAPAQLAGLLVPSFFGRDPATYWGAWDRVEVGYVGVLTLLLAALALLVPRRVARPWRSQIGPEERASGFAVGGTYRYASLAAFGLLLAMGGYAALHGWLYALVPGLGSMRAPARAVFLMDFALAALAGLGLDILMHDQGKSVRRALRRLLRASAWVIAALALVAIPLAFYAIITSQDKDPAIFRRVSAATSGLVFFTALLVACVGLFYLRQRGRLRPVLVGALAVGLLFFDLASLGSSVDVGYDDPTRNFDHPGILGFLQADPGVYRIDSRTDVWHVWQPNTPLLGRIFDVGGLTNPLTLADYDRYWRSIPSRSSRLYDFLNAKYVIAAKDVELDWQKFVPVYDAEPALNVYLNREAMPRALVVHQARVAADHPSALAAIQEPDFDPAREAVIEGGEPLDVVPAGAATIQVDAFGPNEIWLRVDTPAEAYMVLSEVWYPGWQARVDGVEAPVLRANYAFRAVRLGPGQHRVQLTFAPSWWRLGLTISGVTLLVLVGWGATARMRRKRQVSAQPTS